MKRHGGGDDGGFSKRMRPTNDPNNVELRILIPTKPVVQSSVTVPLKDVKSREDAITEQKGVEKREVTVRNRRMFGVLLGTLQKFKKDEEKHSFKDQEKKQKEIETRLEETKRQERAQLEKDRQKLLEKRRRQEQAVFHSRRKKALIAATENQIALFKRLQNFIQTNTKPPIFFMPVKHSIRTIELQKKSQKKLEELIKLKQEETDLQLKEMDDNFVGVGFDDEDDDHDASISQSIDIKSVVKEKVHEAEKIATAGTLDDDAIKSNLDVGSVVKEETNGQEGNIEQQQQLPLLPPKPKDIHEELTELTAGYNEELNFEDDDQQR